MQRARSFLGSNFYGHQQLSKSGADIEVVETLLSMIRGEECSVSRRAISHRRRGRYSGTAESVQLSRIVDDRILHDLRRRDRLHRAL